jgi:hypothetical protein
MALILIATVYRLLDGNSVVIITPSSDAIVYGIISECWIKIFQARI